MKRTSIRFSKLFLKAALCSGERISTFPIKKFATRPVEQRPPDMVMAKLKLTFWMNMPSFYQGDLFRALVKTGQVDLRVIFSQRIPIGRSRLGWDDDLAGFDHEFLDGRIPAVDAARKVRRDATGIHVVGGLWAGAVVEAVLMTLMYSGARYFLYSEAPDPRVEVPRWKQMILAPVGRNIVRRAQGIFSVSHFAADYFRLYGADDSAIYPFGYFRSFPPRSRKRSRGKEKKEINIVFVGQMIHRKGIDILLSAIESLLAENENLFLQLIGVGELEQRFRRWVGERSLTRRITFEGRLASKEVISRISQSDLLVLPSRWDGWGIVINEAFMASVPVIASSMCGAADMVNHGRNGFVFPSENTKELAAKLARFVTSATLRRKMKEEATKTGIGLDAEIAARYLVDLLGSPGESRTVSSRLPWTKNVKTSRRSTS